MQLKHHAKLRIYKLEELGIFISLLLSQPQSLGHPRVRVHLSLLFKLLQGLGWLESLTDFTPELLYRLEHFSVVLREVKLLYKLSEFVKERIEGCLPCLIALQ